MTRQQEGTVGFVGTGNIGSPMVMSLIRAGFDVMVHDLRRASAASLEDAGARFAETHAELAAECSIIGVAVVNDTQLTSLLLGADGLIAALKPGTTVVVHSTVLPATVKEIAKTADLHGVHLLDAQVSGGDLRAAQGDLAVMVGGEPENVASCSAYFDAIARRAVHMGPLGSGAGAKIAVQMMTFGNWIAAMEAMRLAGALGIAEDRLADLATDATCDSWVVQNWGNYDRLQHAHRLAGTPELYRLFDKDLHLAVSVGRELDIELPLTAVGSAVLAPAWKQRLEFGKPEAKDA